MEKFIDCSQGLNHEQGRALYAINILCEVSSNASRNLTINSIEIQVFSESLVALTDYNNHKVVD